MNTEQITEKLHQEFLSQSKNRDLVLWTLSVIEKVLSVFPTADIYSSRLSKKNGCYLIIGSRAKEAKNGNRYFFITLSNTLARVGLIRKGQLACYRNGGVDDCSVTFKNGSDVSPEQAEIWLKNIQSRMTTDNIHLKGHGHFPTDYEKSPIISNPDEDDDESPDEEDNIKQSETTSISLNQILFGPPGTGKTYYTINKALEILDPEFLTQHQDGSDTARKALKARFDELVKAGRIDFVTFHQSFSYEDFVEGIRAQSNASDQLEYKVEPGVFKRLCDIARTSEVPVTTGIRSKPRIWKISINGTADNSTRRYCFDHNEARIGWGMTGDLTSPDLEQSNYYNSLKSNDRSTLNSLAQEMVPGDIVVCIRSVEQIEAIGVVSGPYRFESQTPEGIRDDFQHVRPVNWLYSDVGLSILSLNDDVRFTLKTIYPLDRFSWGDLLTYLQQSGKQPQEAAKLASTDGKKPYVLIIDEINRGNVSRIFGELITLIEPSKRAGAIEELSTTLPYSKKLFSVPDNLYLIGTMNTADRSLAGLDIALRRRFTFVEMPPKPELLADTEIDGVNIGQLLEVMNQRIEVLLDRDHCLGHAYFLPLNEVKTVAKLASIFRNQILPLLQEYFFEDWERIAWVLNDHRKSSLKTQFLYQPNLDIKNLLGNVPVGGQRRRWNLNEKAFINPSSYQLTIKGDKVAE